MKDGHAKHAIDLLIMQTTFIGDMWSGKFNVRTANPYRNPQEFDSIKTPEQKADDTKMGFMKMGRYLSTMGTTKQ